MAFPADYTLLRKIPINASAVTGSNNNFVGIMTEAAFKSSKSFIFANTDNGGGDVRYSTDAAGSNQIAIDLRAWDTSLETCELAWLASGVNDVTPTDLYIWGDNTGDTQPIDTAPFGRNATYSSESNRYMMQTELGNLTDVTGNYDAVAYGTSALFAPLADFGGNCIGFPGIQYFDLDSANDPVAGASHLAVRLWLNSDSGNHDGVSGRWNTDSNMTYLVWMGGNKVNFRLKNSSGTVKTITGATTVIGTGIHHVAVLYDGINMKIFVDGVEDATDTFSGNLSTASSPSMPQIGSYDTNTANTFHGLMQECAISTNNTIDGNYIVNERSNQSDIAGFYLEPEIVSGGVTIVIDSGNYSQLGTVTPIASQLSITTTAGSYLLTGSDVNLISAKKLISETGSYNLSGTDVTLIYTPGGGGEVLIVESGVYSLSGDEVLLNADLSIIGNSGNYTQAGTNTNIKYGAFLSVDTAVYSLIGSNLNLLSAYGIITESIEYTLTGTSVTLKYSGDVNQVIGTVTAGFAADLYSVEYKPNQITVTFKV